MNTAQCELAEQFNAGCVAYYTVIHSVMYMLLHMPTRPGLEALEAWQCELTCTLPVIHLYYTAKFSIYWHAAAAHGWPPSRA